MASSEYAASANHPPISSSGECSSLALFRRFLALIKCVKGALYHYLWSYYIAFYCISRVPYIAYVALTDQYLAPLPRKAWTEIRSSSKVQSLRCWEENAHALNSCTRIGSLCGALGVINTVVYTIPTSSRRNSGGSAHLLAIQHRSTSR